jgi:hypothetical protein
VRLWARVPKVVVEAYEFERCGHVCCLPTSNISPRSARAAKVRTGTHRGGLCERQDKEIGLSRGSQSTASTAAGALGPLGLTPV